MKVLSPDYESSQEQLDFVLNEALELTESEYGYIYLMTRENWSLP